MKTEKTIDEEIFEELSRKGRGRIFFAQEFYDSYADSSVRFALGNLARDGKIARLARGVFCFPELTEHGMRMILPDADTIAHAVAEKTCVRIVPSGDQAAYMVGLTGLSLSRTTYLTDGAPRTMRLANGRTIEFVHTSEMRIFAFSNRKMQLVSAAVRAIGRENIRIEERETIKWQLDSVPPEDFAHDINLCPGWVRNMLYDLRTH